MTERDEIEQAIERLVARWRQAANIREEDGAMQYPDIAQCADDLEQAVSALLRRRSGETAGWQPIATAPRDNTAILVFSQWLGPVIVRVRPPERRCKAFDHNTDWQTEWDGQHLASEPTHWMPLPSPPKDSGEIPEPDSHTGEKP